MKLSPPRPRRLLPFLTPALALGLAGLLAAGCGSSGSSSKQASSKRSSSTSSLAWPGAPTKLAKDAGCTVTTPKRKPGVHIGENPELRLVPQGWTSDPPASGEHFGITSRWGFFDRQLQDAYSVHDLEHGGVVIWYGSDPKAVETTYGHVATKLIKVVISPRKQLGDGELDLVAWGLLATCPASVTEHLGAKGTQSFLEKWGASAQDGAWAPEKGIPAVQTGTRDSIEGNGTSLLTLPTPPDPLIDTTLTNAQAQAQAQAQAGN